MEYLTDCKTLKQHIDDILHRGDTRAAETVMVKIGQLIACLHSNNIVHGDLTTSNVLVTTQKTADDDYELILIDFGLTAIQSAHIAEDKGEITCNVM